LDLLPAIILVARIKGPILRRIPPPRVGFPLERTIHRTIVNSGANTTSTPITIRSFPTLELFVRFAFSRFKVNLQYWLSLEHATLSPDGVPKDMEVFNGTYPGPLLEANWGDWMYIHVTNNLKDNG
jgi:Multicopper oxidase